MNRGVTYRTTDLTTWNDSRRGEIELGALARAYLGDSEITDRDRIAFALRELRKMGYEADAEPVDWTKAKMISSLYDSELMAFGEPKPSERYKRLSRIAERKHLLNDEIAFENLLAELYDEDQVYDTNADDSLEEPYEFTFKGDPALVEGVFQDVGFATRVGLSVPDDGSETHHVIHVAPSSLVCAPDAVPGR